MLVAVLNTCSKEELEEVTEEAISPVSRSEGDARRKVIKGKIMAVGRMSRVFALLRSVVLFYLVVVY
jgi:serine/threonine-protein phosphatase 2B catalytic subunit